MLKTMSDLTEGMVLKTMSDLTGGMVFRTVTSLRVWCSGLCLT